MDLLQTIFSNNRLAVEAVEQAAPVVGRLAEKLAECLKAGGRIFCMGGDSPVPGEYGQADSFIDVNPDPAGEYGVGLKDAVIAFDDASKTFLAAQMRAFRRRGMLTACITGETASPVASASEIALCLTVATAVESRPLKVRLAQQMALDAVLTLALAQTGASAAKGDAPAKSGDPLKKAAATLMKELPALDEESAQELIQRHGSVRKAAKAYKANVQAKL